MADAEPASVAMEIDEEPEPTTEATEQHAESKHVHGHAHTHPHGTCDHVQPPEKRVRVVREPESDGEDTKADDQPAPLEYVIEPGSKEVVVNNARLRVMPDLTSCPDLEHLELRQNFIVKLEGLAPLRHLQRLDMYENQLKDTSGLEGNHNLEYLDLSFNGCRSRICLPPLPRLRELYLVQNKITSIPPEAVNHLTSLTLLELGSNRMRSIANIDKLVNLRELYLGRNKITAIQGLETLTKLEKLSIQSNRIVDMEGLSTLTSLQELYLSHNGILKISGLEALTSLRVLDLSANRISKLEGVAQLVNLDDLWINNNYIESFDDVKEQTANMTRLTTIYLEHNPLQQDPQYREKVLEMVPQLEQLDGDLIGEI